MGVFDNRRSRRPRGTSGGDSSLDQFGGLEEEVPEIEGEVSAIDAALALGKPKVRDCGCWD